MNISVPKELRHSLLFPQETIVLTDEKRKIVFLPEILFYNQISMESPWLHPDEGISSLMDRWNRVKVELVNMLKSRNNDIGTKMLEGTHLFFRLLFWSNNRPVQLYEWERHLRLLAIKPFNCEERLHFIAANYRTYPAFIQLSELFIEQQKHFAKKTVMEKYKQK